MHACMHTYIHTYIHTCIHTCIHIYIYIYINLLSFIAVAMNSRDRYKILGLREFSHFIKQPCRNVCLDKNVIITLKLLKQCSTLAKQCGKLNILIYSKLLKFQASPKFHHSASQSAVRLGSDRCKSDFSQVMYSRVRFTNFSIC